jgi:hypothetical protein
LKIEDSRLKIVRDEKNPPCPPLRKGGNNSSPFSKGGLRGIKGANAVEA